MSSQNKRKCLFVATVAKTHINQFHLPYLQMFQSYGYETHVAAKDDFSTNGEICEIPYCDHFFSLPFKRFPFSLENVQAYQALKKLIKEGNYEVIHCHTPVGGMIGRLAARKARKKGTRVFYTAHGFHFFKGAPLKNWILYYPVERLAARWTDVLITINQEDYCRAKKFAAKEVVYVPGVGVQVDKFSKSLINVSEKKKELGVPIQSFVLLMIGELSKRKNQETILNVMTRFRGSQVYSIFCGQGEMQTELQKKSKTMGIEGQVRFLGYRHDLPEIYSASDVFLFPTLHEGLSLALMEAMAAGLPVICSDVRGNHDLITAEKGGWLTQPYDISAMEGAIRDLMEHPEKGKSMGLWNQRVVQQYDLGAIKEKMRVIYGLGNEQERKSEQ